DALDSHYDPQAQAVLVCIQEAAAEFAPGYLLTYKEVGCSLVSFQVETVLNHCSVHLDDFLEAYCIVTRISRFSQASLLGNQRHHTISSYDYIGHQLVSPGTHPGNLAVLYDQPVY